MGVSLYFEIVILRDICFNNFYQASIINMELILVNETELVDVK